MVDTFTPGRSGPPWARLALILLIAGLVTGCANGMAHREARSENVSLDAGALELGGVAFLTPAVAFGHEEDPQVLALIFEEALAQARPEIPTVPLTETLGAINQAELPAEYKRMLTDYRDTGIYKQDALEAVAATVDVQYLLRLSLARFTQTRRSRMSVFGFRIMDTTDANVRLFVQIWDAHSGTIAWEGFEELNRQADDVCNRPVTFNELVQEAVVDLIAQLP